MHQIIVDTALQRRFGEVSEQVVVCDADGKVLGFFSPLKDRPAIEDLQLEPPLSIAETEELRRKHRAGKPLDEILGRLGF